MEFLQQLEKLWEPISQEPFAFFTLAILIFIIGYYAARWKYKTNIDNCNSTNKLLEQRIILKTEQNDAYMERALKYDALVHEVVESDSSGLSKLTSEFISNLREFIARYHQATAKIFSKCDPIATDPENRTPEEKEIDDEFMTISSEFHNEYERRFKVDAIMLKDELKSRGVQDTHEDQEYLRFVFERPTNIHGYKEVADSLEKMEKLLTKKFNS